MAPVVSPPKLSFARKDLDYFMTSEYVTFQAEDVLFRVPTYVLISESDVFSAMFPLPQGNKPNAEGTSADNPIKLPEKSEDFKNLLKLLYPLKPFPNPPTSWVNPTREEWISTLKLATKWHFWNARKVALQALQLTRGPPAEGIILGRALKISKWVLEGYQDLANIDQTPAITLETASIIGWESTVKLQQIREDKLKIRNTANAIIATPPLSFELSPKKNRCVSPIFNFPASELELTVEDVFKEELSQIRQAESQYSKAFESSNPNTSQLKTFSP